ncbi:MAG: hypothetical protein JOZ34_01735, partial [Gammaproteobacteria bacterium]|nr:hypothetical protein [Gammaproteobacteria bacterium]
MSRLAKHARIFFFEEPVRCEAKPHLQMLEVSPNICVCRPHTPHAAYGFDDRQLGTVRQLLETLVCEQDLRSAPVWLYTPMALPLLQDLRPELIIYDCMDELAAFHNAPRQLLQRESALLRMATLVFTGGPSLYESKRQRHAAVHCFPSSVEAEHFASARDSSIEHTDQQSLPRPRLGFFGVIDERCDLGLLADLARQRPQWQLVLVGPVAKIDP